ncbi:hypothetical protein MTO96_017645 [Rhipicephalus appendiculatus]
MMDGYPVAPPLVMGPPAIVQENVNQMPPPNYLSASTSESSSNDQTTWSDEQPDITEKNVRSGSGATVIVSEFRVPSTPPPFTTKSTTQASTEKETTEHTTEDTETPFPEVTTDVRTKRTTAELPPTPAKKYKWPGLICTIGTKLSAPEIIPDGSWCDYLYYDSVFKKGPAPFDPNHLDPALSIFLGHFSKINATAPGVGFAYKYTQHLKSQLSTKDDATPTVLQHFFDKKICNFGILDTPTDGFDKSTLEEMLESLKLVHGFVKSKGSWPNPCRTVVAVPTPDTDLAKRVHRIIPENIHTERRSHPESLRGG